MPSRRNLHHLAGNINKSLPLVTHGKGSKLFLQDENRWVFDASGGAAVVSLGYNNKDINKAMIKQIKTGVTYASSAYWSNKPVQGLSKKLANTTGGKLPKVYITGSGSEAMEAAMKVARQYFYSQDNNTPRINFISRNRSYHGNTLGSLSVSHFHTRKQPYVPLLLKGTHMVSSCYPYRQLEAGESMYDFVLRKSKELEDKFLELGPDSVIAFIAEPVVGAALGCVSFVPGYLKAMQEICHKYGALLILDEVMCGAGRTGTFHAWQKEPDLSPDVQTMAKGLGSGYQSVGAVMVCTKIAKVFEKHPFVHGQTFESMPICAAAALEVLNIIEKRHLVDSVYKKGLYLGKRLKKSLGSHPNVGDIRGSGFFWGVEFVESRSDKKPFDSKLDIAYRVKDLALSPEFGLSVYPGTGCVDGINGDHIMICPSFLIRYKDIDYIVDVLSEVIERVFKTK